MSRTTIPVAVAEFNEGGRATRSSTKDACSMKHEPVITLVVDAKLRQPACVLLQAAYGCGGSNSFVCRTFDTEDWLLAPTANMAKVTGTEEQWRQLAAVLRNRRKRK